MSRRDVNIRSNPDQDLADLNRDAAKSFEVREKADISLSVKNPVESIRDGIDIVRQTEKEVEKVNESDGIKNYLEGKTKGRTQSARE